MRFISLGGLNIRGNHCQMLCGETTSLLLDCGKGGPLNPAPELTPEIAAAAGYLLVSHSHLDHVGQIPLLLSLGFKGKIVTTKETFDACGSPKDWDCLFIAPGQTLSLSPALKITAHRAGHCLGAVWYDIGFEGKRIVYSGDYIEGGSFKTDLIRGIKADLGIFDGSYLGKKVPPLSESLAKISKIIRDANGKVFLPAPANGRGLSLMSLAQSLGFKTKLVGSIFIENPDEWLSSDIPLQPDSPDPDCILFSDKDFEKKETVEMVESDLSRLLLFTGNLDEGSVAEDLFRHRGNTAQCFYNIHETEEETYATIKQNDFAKVLIFSSNKTDYPLSFDL